jgi:MtN3 and saliva related transmembrane protein
LNSIDLVGYAAAFCTTVAYIPQVMRVWQTRSTDDISLRMYLVLALGLALWAVFGVLKSEMPIIVANVISFVLASSILAFKLRNG